MHGIEQNPQSPLPYCPLIQNGQNVVYVLIERVVHDLNKAL